MDTSSMHVPSFISLIALRDRSSWLSQFSDKTLREIPLIPGTHNSAAIAPLRFWSYLVWPWVQNQNLEISTQLALGVRYLDLRVSQLNDQIFCSHWFLTSLTLADALKQIRSFLETHPTEFILLYIRADFDNQASTDFSLVRQVVRDELFPQNCRFLYTGDFFSLDIPVAELQGKVLLFHEFPFVFESEASSRDSPTSLVSFDAEDSMDLVQMWKAPLFEAFALGKETVERFFNSPSSRSDKMNGIVCDLFASGWRKTVAYQINKQIRKIKNPINKNPGIVAVDFFDEALADALFSTYIESGIYD